MFTILILAITIPILIEIVFELTYVLRSFDRMKTYQHKLQIALDVHDMLAIIDRYINYAIYAYKLETMLKTNNESEVNQRQTYEAFSTHVVDIIPPPIKEYLQYTDSYDYLLNVYIPFKYLQYLSALEDQEVNR